MRLTVADKKKIAIDYAINPNKSEIARKYGVSDTTVKRIVDSPEMSELLEKVEQKKQDVSVDIETYMNQCRDKVVTIIGKYLDALSDQDKIDGASVNQLTTALGTLIDKWTMTGTDKNAEVRLAYLVKKDAPEQPPEDIEDEADE